MDVVRKELLDQLQRGIRELTDSRAWARYLAAQSRFHGYSYANVLLIGAQREDATMVAGAGTWRRFGRHIRRGEQAIWILAPMRARARAEEGSDAVRGFIRVPVFDVAQTDGDPLPSVCDPLVGEDPTDLFGALRKAARSLGYSVRRVVLPAGVNGDCTYSLRRIRVSGENSPAQQVKTLAHELAHVLMAHDGEDRARAELEAESVAYVVCSHFGLDTAGYSFGYVASWAGGGEAAVAGITQSCRAIQTTVRTLLRLAEAERGDHRASDRLSAAAAR